MYINSLFFYIMESTRYMIDHNSMKQRSMRGMVIEKSCPYLICFINLCNGYSSEIDKVVQAMLGLLAHLTDVSMHFAHVRTFFVFFVKFYKQIYKHTK